MTIDRALLAATLARIEPADPTAARMAQEALDAKAKPPRSLGRLEDLVCKLAGIRGNSATLRPAVVVCGADHGVADEGVSAYPQAVTAAMVAAFASGRAAVSVLARQAGARLVVADLGVRTPTNHPGVLDRRIGAGTANAARGPAMSRPEADRAVATGIELASSLADEDVTLIAIGEMGIANTTTASALTAALLGVDPTSVCGRGTGVDDAGLAHKVDVVRRMLAVNEVDTGEPLSVLAALGGFEIGALVGLVLGGAARRVPIVLDGFITGAAALIAARLAPACVDAMIASHCSPEPGHARILAELGLDPLFSLDMRLGEASGAALALPLIGSSMAVVQEMATLDEVAAVPRPTDEREAGAPMPSGFA
jgi:nicotinate-nucleotide--dimethylbenzimidazole phosphoribosyltransferase